MKTLAGASLLIVLSALSAATQGIEPKALAVAKSLLDVQPSEAFKETKLKELPKYIRSQSKNHLALFLRQDAHPFRADGLKVWAYEAEADQESDLLKYRWRFGGAPLEIVENRNVVRVSLPVKNGGSLLKDVLNLSGRDRWDRQFNIPMKIPDTPKEGFTYSSNPEADIMRLSMWHERVDVYVESGRLHAFFYKKVPKFFGYQNGATWFEDAARTYEKWLQRNKAKE